MSVRMVNVLKIVLPVRVVSEVSALLNVRTAKNAKTVNVLISVLLVKSVAWSLQEQYQKKVVFHCVMIHVLSVWLVNPQRMQIII